MVESRGKAVSETEHREGQKGIRTRSVSQSRGDFELTFSTVEGHDLKSL